MTDTQNNSTQQEMRSSTIKASIPPPHLIQQNDIHIISQYSNASENTIRYILKQHIYNNHLAWQKLLQWLLLGLGIGFLVAGIIFFFAYNWADLPKLIKMAIIQVLLIATVSVVVFTKLSTQIKNMILVGATGLVGVLFAVYGQIYQTGADAYDFFLAWSIFTLLWVVVSNAATMWLLFIILVNTTVALYSQQVAYDWSFLHVITLLMVINSVIVILATWLTKYRRSHQIPAWFLDLIALSSVAFATIGLSVGIFQKLEMDFLMLFVVTTLFYSLAIWNAFKIKSSFYLAVIPFSLTIICSAFLLNWIKNDSALLPVSIFIVIAVTLIVKNMIHFQRQWRAEE